jgi:murein DD-endopeptidase MepM/ murein hydrolase activator NlpD
MEVPHRDIERLWLRTTVLLTLVTVLFVLVRHSTWPVPASAPGPATAPEPTAAPAAAPVPASPKPATGLLFPLAGYAHALRDNFHEKRGIRTHKALDIMAPRGTPVRAVDDGRIAKLYRGPMAGIAVYQFDPASRRVYFYAHLDRYAAGLEEGHAVSRGDVIGYVGSTGNAGSTNHLHFEYHPGGGAAINPYQMLLAVC